MKPSELLRRAADILFENHNDGSTPTGCCNALHRGWKEAPCDATTFCSAGDYLELFNPDDYTTYWWGHPYISPATDERLFALLLAAEIAESEGK
jgi:hypothetical protein